MLPIKEFKWVIITILSLIISVGIIVPTVSSLAWKENQSRTNSIIVSDNYAVNDSFRGVFIDGWVTAVDVVNCQMKMSWIVRPSALLLSETTPIPAFQNATIIEFDTAKIVTFEANKRIATQDTTFSLTECSPNLYPFDNYTVEFNYFRAIQGSKEIEIVLSIGGSLQGWDLDPKIDKTYDYDLGIVFAVVGARSLTVKFFSVFIQCLLWLITLGAFLMTVTFIHLNFMELPVIALLTTLLFALPNLRNTQPGIPPIGVYADVTGFFWNMVIIAISGNYILT
jgi:hypothetical protein